MSPSHFAIKALACFVGLISCASAAGAEAPAITVQPKNRSVVAGTSDSFSVTATGDAPLRYQWSFASSALTGETNSTLLLSNIQPANAGNYSVVVSNNAGAVTSAVAILVVRATNDPVYAAPDGGWTYRYDGNGTGSLANAALDGTWNRPTSSDSWAGDGRGAGNGLLGGVSSSNGVLTIEDAVATGTTVNNRRIYFIHNLSQETSVTNADTILDAGVTLTFRARITPPPPDDPLTELTNAPNGYVNFNGGKGMFGIRQSGGNGMLISFSLNRLLEDINTTFNMNFGQAGLHMNSLNGNVSSPSVDPGSGVINLLPIESSDFHEFWITIQENGSSAGTHRVSVYVDGAQSPTVFNVTAGIGSESPSTITNYLAMGLPSTAQRGGYDIDFYGYKSGVVLPTGYNDPVAISTQPVGQSVALGQTATFSVTVTGTPPFAYQWYRDGSPIANATNSAYTTEAVDADDDGDAFVVVVSNICNIVTSSPPAVLQILIPPTITAQPQSVTVTNGDPASFTVTAQSAATLYYQWRFNGSNLAGETNSTLAFSSVSPSHAGSYDVVVSNIAGSVTSTVATLTVRVLDFGDAPDSYTTLLANNGARHLIVSGINLGAAIDAEVNGQTNGLATGDDLAGVDDEDGVTFASPLQAGNVAIVEVVASTNGFLNAWMDFNGNGAWTEAGEQIFTNRVLSPGTNLLNFVIPGAAAATDSFARFRFGTATDLSFNGPAADGEVEDYAVTITPLADLVLAMVEAADPVPVNSNIVYTIFVSNAGPSTATAVLVDDALPPSVTVVSFSSSQGSCARIGDTIRCTLGSLAPDNTATVNLTLASSVTAILTNTAVVSAAQVDPFAPNNTATEVTTVEAPPSISAQPVSLVVTQGNPVSFTVTASGSAPLAYQWLFSGNPLTGETNTALSIAAAQPANEGAYTVRITNRVGAVLSAAATLTVLVPPAITQQPVSRTNAAGSQAVFSVTATGSQPLFYQWFRNAASVSAETNATITLNNVQKNQAGDYTATVSNSAGVVTSAVARLTVLELDFGDAPPPYPTLAADNGARHIVVVGLRLGASLDFEPNGLPNPIATGDDTNSIADEDGITFSAPLFVGQTGTVAVVASTGGVLNAWIDWAANGNWSDAGDQVYTNRLLTAGTNLLSLSIPSSAAASNTLARFRFSSVSNLTFTGEAPDGEVEDYRIGVLPVANLAVSLTDAPDPVAVGSNLVYTVTVTNSGPSAATTVILSNNVSGNITVISAIPSQGSCSNIGGAVTCAMGTVSGGAMATLQLTVTANQAQTITNRVSVAAAETDSSLANNSAIATTLAQVYPVITSQPQSQTVTNSSTAVMTVNASGTALQYQWLKQGTNLPGEINPSLIISNVQSVHAGTYTVRVSNSVGIVMSDPAVLTVLVRPQITSQPQSQTVRRGDPFSLSVTANGTQPLAYQWFLNGSEVPGATSSVLSIANAQPEHEGTYTVLVSNSTGSEQSQPATITLLTSPSISQQPQSRTNTARSTATFSVTATGTAPLSYRWFFNQTTPVANATNTTLTLTNVQRSQDGNYSVVVTNAGGAVTSILARLVVLETDFGDAPAIGYPTLFAFNGARHQVVAGIHLGSRVDFEADGQPSSGATGDDTETSDDEDGITFTSPLLIGQAATLQVVASTNGFLDAWIDFDRNGAWSDLPDQIFSSQPVSPGINLLVYQVPSTALATNTFARFRFSTNGGLFSDGPASNGEVEDYQVTVQRVIDLSAAVSSAPEPVPIFSNLTYSITVSNSGPSACSAARLIDPLPLNLQFVSVNSTRGSCTNDGGTIDCALGTLGQGQTAIISLVVRPMRGALYTNQITVTGPEFDADLANNAVETVSTAIGTPAPFVNSDNLVIADPGIASRYPSTITVAGLTSMIYKVSVTLSNLTHNWPADLDVLLVGPAGQSVLLMSDAAAGERTDNVTVQFEDASPIAIPEAGRLVEATFRPTNYGSTNDVFPAPAPAGPYGSQLAVFTGTNPNGTWSLYVLDDEAQDSGNIAGGWRLQITTLDPIADLGVTVRAQPEPVAVESNLTYTITVTNRGPAGAAGVVLSNSMPPNVTFISAVASQGICTNESGLITCGLGSLAANGRATVTLVIRPERGGLLTNAFTITGNETDIIGSNNTAVIVSSVRAVVDLVLALTEAPEPAGFGQSLNYFLRVTNLGPNRAHAVVASDPLPPGIAFTAVTASQGSCSNEAGTVVCNFGELATGAVATATITATANVMGPFTNTASVSADEIELNPANNSAAEVTTGAALFGPLAGPGLTVPTQGLAAPYPSTINVFGLTGEVYEVSVTLSNISHTFPDDLDILLVGPEGHNVLLVSDAGDGNAISNVTITLNDSFTAQLPDSGAILSGQVRPTQYEAGSDVFPPGAPPSPYGTNLAVFQRTDPNGIWSLYVLDDRPTNSGSMSGWSLTIATLAPIADVSVAASASPAPVAVGSNLVYTFTVTNRGPAPATGVTLSNSIPASVSFVSVATSQGTCSNIAGRVECAMGGLPVGSNAQVTVTVVPNTAGVVSNQAAVAGIIRDHRVTNNAAVIQTTVENPAVIVQHPQSITVTNGGTATFSVSFAGAQPFSFQWQYNGVDLPGQTNSTLILSNVQLAEAGGYRVRVSNRVGAVLSQAATLTVLVRPTISGIPNQTTDEDVAVGPIPFSVQDHETAAAALVVSATSSDPLLAPPAGIILSGSGTNRFIQIAPGTNRFGTVTIMLVVEDSDGITATTAFELLVRSVNDLPTISVVQDQTIDEDTPTTVNFSVDDVETTAGALIVSVSSSSSAIVPTNSMVLGGNDNNRTLQFQSALDQFGVATISLTVRDADEGTANTSFAATILPVNDPPTLDLPPPRVVDEDSSTEVALTGITAGPSNEIQALTVTARSSNPAVIPDPVVTYTSANPTGSLALTMVTNANGAADIIVTVQDDSASNNIITRTFSVTVRPVNDAPAISAVPDIVIEEDSSATDISVIVSDIDTAVEEIIVTGSSSNAMLLANSNIVVSGSSSNRTVSLIPSTNEFGMSMVTLTVTDSGGAISSNMFLLTVLPVNDPPTLDPPSPITVDEDSEAQTIQLTGITSGAVNEPQTLTVTARSSDTSLVRDPVVTYSSAQNTGSLTLTFETNAHGAAEIVVTVQDDGASNNILTRTFAVTVRPVNDPPEISTVPDVIIEEDSTATGITVIVSDIDTTLEGLTVTGSSSNAVLLANSNIVVTGSSSNRSVTLIPSPNEFGTSAVTLTVADGGGGVASNMFLLTVLPVNDAPVFNVPADLTIAEDSGLQVIPITGISSGFYNEAQTITITGASTNLDLITNLVATYTSPDAAGTLSFGTVSNVSGIASITITADDGGGSNNITVQTLTVTIEAVNDLAQIVAPANQTIPEDSATAALPFTIGDMESSASALAVTAFSSDPALVPDAGITLSGGDSNRFVTVTPLPNQHGVATINLRVTDPDNGVSVASFSVNVTAVNDPPAISSIPTQITAEDTALVVPFTIADLDDPLETLQLSATSPDAELLPATSFVFGVSGTNRIVTITPATNDFGATTVTISVRDSSNAVANTSFYLAVNAVNDAPTISDISNQATDENVTTAVIPFTVSDIETAAGSLQISAVSSDAVVVPQANIIPGGSGSNRTVRVRPATNQTGTVSIRITVRDTQGAASSDDFDLVINPIDAAPGLAAIPDQAMAENQVLSVPIAISDSDTPVGSLVVTATSSNPSVVPNSGLSVTGTGADRVLTISPAVNQSGMVTITVAVADAGNTNSRAFELTIAPVNDPPSLDFLSDITLPEDFGTRTIALSGITAGAADENQPLTISVAAEPPGIVANVAASFDGTSSTGVVSFASVSNVTGSVSVTVSVNDDGASNNVFSRTFNVIVEPADDAPEILPIAAQATDEDTPLVLALEVRDVDTPLQNLVLSGISSNEALVNGNIQFHGSSQSRLVVISPAIDQFGSTEIRLSLTDGTSTTSQNFLLDVIAVNDAPTLDPVGDIAVRTGSGQRTIDLLGISDGAANETQTLSIVATSSNPALVPNPSITYTNPDTSALLRFTPAATGIGTALITVTIDDGGASNNITRRFFTVYVRESENQPPIISAIADQTTPQNTPISVSFQIDDSETPPDNLTLQASAQPSTLISQLIFGGTGTNRTLQISPATDQTGTTIITISVRDAEGGETSKSFLLTVTPPTPSLSLSAISDQTTPEDTPVTVAFALGHPLPDFSVLTATSSNTALLANTNILFSGSGSNRTVTLIPSLNATGTTLVTVAATNGSVGATRTFLVTVTAVNDRPTLNPLDDRLFNSGNQQMVDIPLSGITSGAANETQTLSITAISSAPTVVSIQSVTYTSPATNGSVRIRILANVTGRPVITVNVSDGQATNSQSFTVFVKLTGNASPTISAIPNQTIDEDASTGSISFTIGDSATPASLLTLSVTSFNPALLPNSNIVFGGSGSNRTVDVTPLPNQSGTGVVRVTVTDTNFGMVYTNFTVTVRSLNDLPVASTLSDRTVGEDPGVVSIPISVGDVETPANHLVLSASSQPSFLISQFNFGGSGSERMVLITPAPNEFGLATVNVNIQDADGGATARTFSLAINPVNDAPTLDRLNDLSVARGSGAQSVPLTGISSGASNETQVLTVTAVSSQPDSIPHPQITYNSPDTTGTLTFAPTTSASGPVTIMVTVNDGGASNNTITRNFSVAIPSTGGGLPTISDIADQIILEDTTTGLLSFTVEDGETAADALTVTTSSSNPSLVVPALDGSGTNRTVTLAPLPDMSGTAIVTIAVIDSDFGFASTSFLLTVVPTNDPPTLSWSAGFSLSVGEDTETSPLPLTVGDAETPAGDLILTASSSNPALIPDANIFLGGSGSNRTVVARPLPNQSGMATLTLRVSDGSANAQIQFDLTVTATNDPPTISSIGDQITDEDVPLGPIAIAIDDVEPGALILSVTSSNPELLPPANVIVEQASSLIATPVTNKFGEARVTLTVSDEGGASASTPFLLTVRPINDPPTLDALTGMTLNVSAAIQVIGLTGITSGDSNEIQTLAISATSSNPQLIPHPMVTYTSPATTGTLSFRPVAGASGTATITVTVNDGQPAHNLSERTFTVTVNGAPNIAPLTDHTTDEDVPTSPIALTVSDPDTAADLLNVTVSSSYPALIPNANIVLSGAGTNRFLTITPTPNRHGFSIIHITASDPQGNSSSTSFALIVLPVNDRPTISEIPDQSIAVNGTAGPIGFSIYDLETATAHLWITATSSNPLLVTDGNILLEGNGSARSVTIQPLPDQQGTSTITISVTDTNGGTTTETFLLTVNGGGTAPAITRQPADQSVLPGRTATFVVTATGNGPLTYQWHRNGVALSGATSPMLAINNAQNSDIGEYTVEVSNAHGTIVSAPARLAILVASTITSFSWSPTAATISFETLVDLEYTVQYTDSLSPPDWTTLETIVGIGAVATVTDSNPTSATRFYRIRAE